MLRLFWCFGFVLPLTHFRIGSCIRLWLLPVLRNYLSYISPTWSQSAEGTGWRDSSHRCMLDSCKWLYPNCDGPAVTRLQESDASVNRRQLECAHLTESPLKPLYPILTAGSGVVSLSQMKPGRAASNTRDGNSSRWDVFLAIANCQPFMRSDLHLCERALLFLWFFQSAVRLIFF